MLASARLASTRDMISPRGRTVREYVYAATTIGAVTLSDEHDDHVWVSAPGALELTDSAAAAFSLAS